jgi:hypothetical protein
MVASGQSTSAAAQGLLGFLDHSYFGGLSAAPFNGSSVTGITPTANGTVWFTCANGVLGSCTNGQSPVAVTLNGALVQISSLVVGSNGTAWFVTKNGQTGFCPAGQTAATADPLASLAVTVPSGGITAGNQIALTVTAQDAAGNVILDFPGTVQFSSSDAKASLPASHTFTSGDQGSTTFGVTLRTPGKQTITVTSGSVTSTITVQVVG